MNKQSSKVEKLKAQTLDAVKDELGKLSPIKKWLFEVLFEKIWAIFGDDCNGNEVTSAINSLDKINTEYVRPTDVMNYDECLKYLHFGNNRLGFKRLMDAKGIEQVIFKNKKIGYRRADIVAVGTEIEEEYRKKKFKPKKVMKKECVDNFQRKLSNMEKKY